MNIFILDRNPILAAQLQHDSHVVKMSLESAQMVSTVLHKVGRPAYYKPTHPHHPCTVWAGQSRQNFAWLLQHTYALFDEYAHRYDRQHNSRHALMGIMAHDLDRFPDLGLTPFAQAMPEQYRDPDAVVAYRAYYRAEKHQIRRNFKIKPVTWRKRPIPNFMADRVPKPDLFASLKEAA